MKLSRTLSTPSSLFYVIFFFFWISSLLLRLSLARIFGGEQICCCVFPGFGLFIYLRLCVLCAVVVDFKCYRLCTRARTNECNGSRWLLLLLLKMWNSWWICIFIFHVSFFYRYRCTFQLLLVVVVVVLLLFAFDALWLPVSSLLRFSRFWHVFLW